MPVDLRRLRSIAMFAPLAGEAAAEIEQLRAAAALHTAEQEAARVDLSAAREAVAHERQQANEYLARMYDGEVELRSLRVELVATRAQLAEVVHPSKHGLLDRLTIERNAAQLRCDVAVKAREEAERRATEAERLACETDTLLSATRAQLAEVEAREAARRQAFYTPFATMPDESRPFLDKAIRKIDVLEEAARNQREYLTRVQEARDVALEEVKRLRSEWAKALTRVEAERDAARASDNAARSALAASRAAWDDENARCAMWKEKAGEAIEARNRAEADLAASRAGAVGRLRIATPVTRPPISLPDEPCGRCWTSGGASYQCDRPDGHDGICLQGSGEGVP